ncbi:MAG: ArsR/SmtB family transcription factor [Acidimicrobiia bacterium]
MDEVFKAINDPNRRLLLDALRDDDGQTLGQLCEHLPSMTRQGVMNHLSILEEAHLVTALRKGRSKYHYLNPVPIRLVHDRWISSYAEHRIERIAHLTTQLASEGTSMDKPVHIYKTYIKATVDDVWHAITNPDMTAQYFFGTRVESDWTQGAAMTYAYPDGSLASTGHIIAIDAPTRLEFTFHAQWDDDLAAEGPCREVWSLAEVNGMIELTIELFDVAPDSKTYTDFTNGFPYIAAGLKSLIETGEALPSPAMN